MTEKRVLSESFLARKAYSYLSILTAAFLASTLSVKVLCYSGKIFFLFPPRQNSMLMPWAAASSLVAFLV